MIYGMYVYIKLNNNHNSSEIIKIPGACFTDMD